MTVEAKLRITPQLEAVVAGLRGLLGDVRNLESGVRQADQNGTFSKTRAGLASINEQLAQAKTLFLQFVGVQAGLAGLGALARMSDEYQGLNARLKIATRNQEEFRAALSQTKTLAAQYNQPLAETSSLYTRMLSALRPLGGGIRETGTATEAMLAALKITGATSAEASSAILQFSQAMGSGVLRGEEFNAIQEAAPRLLQAVAEGMGKERFELKALAEQGALTTSAVVSALARTLPQLRQEAATVPATISGALQQVRDAYAQFIGKSAEANGAAAAAVQALKLLAENIGIVAGAISLLASAWAIAKLALWAGVITGTTAAWGGLLALIGGPVGLIVALTAVAAAWLAVGTAQDKARDKSEEGIKKQLAAAREELRLAEEGAGNSPGRRLLMTAAARRKVDALQAELDDFAAKRNGAYRGQRTETQLDDPKFLADLKKDFGTRQELIKEFAEKRMRVEMYYDAQIAKARKANDAAEVNRLKKERTDRLKEVAVAQKDGLQKFDLRDTTTRLVQAKQLYDKDFELLADATQREKLLLQEKFDQGLVDLDRYLAEKKRLQDAEANNDKARLQGQLDEERRVLAINQKRLLIAKDPNSKEQAQEAVLAGQIKVAQLEADIEKKERDRIANGRQLKDEAVKLTAELREQLKTVDAQVKQLRGTETLADIQRRVQDQFAPQLAREFQLGGDGSGTQALIDNTVRREELNRQQALLAQARTDLAQREEAIRIQEAAGAIDAEEAERQLLAARRAQLPVLQELARLLQALAVSPAEQAQAAQAELENKRLADLRTEAQKTLTATAKTGLGQFFQDIVTGSKTAGEALRSMLGNFANQMLQLISQRLGARLFESFGLGRVVDSAASFVATTFGFHQGGVVSEGGATFTRSLNLSPLAVALAPRYHSGGIVGMAPNERLAVLQDGEEVLTANDPRHVNNYRGSGMVVNSSVTVNGAGGTTAAQQGAGADLSRAIEGAIDSWAVKQSRPGGILSRN
jgi:tape measure domain-containing protein